jgi:hypothetical protein
MVELPGILPISRIRLSKRRHVPVIYIGEQSYHPWAFSRIFVKSLGWRFRKVSEELYSVRYKGTTMTLPWPYAFGLAREYFTEWPSYYLPKFSLVGKTVLDAGAGAGESAYFFLQHGASKVLTVERNEMAARLIDKNAEENRWPVERIADAWDNSILQKFSFDFMKMDIEGDEKQLLEIDELSFPAVVESHTPELTKALCDKFRLKARTVRPGMAWMVSNCQ